MCRVLCAVRTIADTYAFLFLFLLFLFFRCLLQLPHQQLVLEVLQQLHFFRPNPKVVKRRIEHLIEREYLERSTEKTNVYRYLA